MKRTPHKPCQFCRDSGYQRTKWGAKRCVHCDTRQVVREGLDELAWWGAAFVGTIVIATVLAVAHSIASGGL